MGALCARDAEIRIQQGLDVIGASGSHDLQQGAELVLPLRNRSHQSEISAELSA